MFALLGFVLAVVPFFLLVSHLSLGMGILCHCVLEVCNLFWVFFFCLFLFVCFILFCSTRV
jgi:hypothetical protein